jgi:hypothetical protein
VNRLLLGWMLLIAGTGPMTALITLSVLERKDGVAINWILRGSALIMFLAVALFGLNLVVRRDGRSG